MRRIAANTVHRTGRGLVSLITVPAMAISWSGRRPKVAAAVSVVLATVLLTATAGFTFLHLREQKIAQARAAAAAAGTEVVPTLLSYDHKTLADETASKIEMLTGAFKADYAKLMREEISPAAQKNSLVTTSTVVGHGVDTTDDDPDRVKLLMFVNQSTGSEGAAPTTAASRISVTMQQVDDRWLVSTLRPV